MNVLRLLVIALLLAAMPQALFAQFAPPALPKMSNLAFGWVSMSGTDPTLDMLSNFAPTMLCVQDAGYRMAGEAAQGTFTFGTLDVDADFQSGIAVVGPGTLRISRYAYDSNTAPILGLGMPGVLAQTDGEAIELSYAQRVGSTSLGISIVPKDDAAIALKQGGMEVLSGTSETQFGARFGFVTPVAHNLRVGGDYSYQTHDTSVLLDPALTGLPVPVTQQGDYITRASTIGVSYTPIPSTLCYAAFHHLTCTGTGLDRVADEFRAGVQHSILKNLGVRVSYLGGGMNYGAMWTTRLGLVQVAYTDGALPNAEDVLGDGRAFFVGVNFAY